MKSNDIIYIMQANIHKTIKKNNWIFFFIITSNWFKFRKPFYKP